MYFDMLRAGTMIELEDRYQLLGEKLDEWVISKGTWVDLKKIHLNNQTWLEEMSLMSRRNYLGLTLGITTTQSLEGSNYHKGKEHLCA